MLFDLLADPDELNDLSNDTGSQKILNELLAMMAKDYDAEKIHQQVCQSQARRLFIRAADEAWADPYRWNWKAQANDDIRYVRGGGLKHGEHATTAKARFPFVDTDKA